jgi:hypothetical protein
MKPRLLRIADHPLTRELASYLARLDAPAWVESPRTTVGDLQADLAAGPLRARDRPRPEAFRRMILPNKRPAWMPDDCSFGSVNYYPPGGSGVGWHTDATSPGLRVYIGRPLELVPGEFYFEGGHACDIEGYAIAFYVSAGGDSWHAVNAPRARLSAGIKIVGPTARELTGGRW